MRRIVFLFFCVLAMSARSQRITQRYENVPLSQALRELNELSRDYEINFLYDELEDFRVTVSLERRSVPEAVRLLVGFYPIRVEVVEHEIYVECPQKSAPRYTGTVVDEQGEPLAYANIALLAPADSTLLTGGMSNDSGVFVIPCEQRPVVARISYVGCKTHFVLCDDTDLGIVRMRSEAVLLDGVQVTAEQVMVTTHDGHLSYLMPPLLKMMPADNAYEALKRIPGIVETCMKAAGVTKDEVLYVGDTNVDMQTGLNAGVDTVGVTWGFRTREELEAFKPLAVIDTAEELEKIILS